MILGLILAALTLAVLVVLLFPLLRKQTEISQRVDYDIVVYRDQLAEVDKDVARELLTSDQAAAARAEIYRRMLAAEDAEEAISNRGLKSGEGFRSRLVLAIALFIAVPLGAGLLYIYLGSPELPGKSYAEQKNSSEFAMATEAEKWAAQLAIKPDAEGFKRLADTYFTLRRYDQAASAYQQVIDMNGGNATVWSELGEALTIGHEDLVVPEAHKAFTKALRLDKHDARARFYLGLSETQINEPRRAVAIWRDLEKDSPADAPWLAMVREHITSFAKDGGFDPLSVPPEPPSLLSPHDVAVKGTGKSLPAASSAADTATSIMAMKPDDQKIMIHKMVDRLAEKMKANPNDLDGWSRLANAYRVLGETDKAQEAEGKAEALKANASRPSVPLTQNASPAKPVVSDSSDAATAIMAMSPDGQSAAIHKMVDRLAAKMDANPNDLDGWARLANAYRVLGETDKAKMAEDRVTGLKAKMSAGGK